MDSLVENGRRLFDFLAALQKSKENPVEKTRDYERSGGAVLPLHSLGDYVSQSKIAVGSHIQEGFKTSGDVGKVLEDDPHLLIEFNRFNVSKFPTIPTNVKPWIVDAPDNSQLATVRRESIEREGQVITFAEESDNVKQSVNAWLRNGKSGLPKIGTRRNMTKHSSSTQWLQRMPMNSNWSWDWAIFDGKLVTSI